MNKVGFSSIGLHFPSIFLSVENLAKLRNVDPDKYTIGLGCRKISLCPENISVVELAVEAAKRALSRWGGTLDDIGLLAVGTESAPDMSRPLSAFVAEKLGIHGAVRSYEVKHACYGGTLAIRQALEWKLANIAPKKAALVIAADISLYKVGDPGEPTQGAGAVAFIIDTPDIAAIDSVSYPFSKPVFDFWRPENEPFPLVNGDFSLECYKKAARTCFKALCIDKNIEFANLFDVYKALCFHVPFPKMVKKAFADICLSSGIDPEQCEQLFLEKVNPTMEWNSLTGNSYTASLWVSVAKTLCGLHAGDQITAFSYGSGCGAELLVLRAGNLAAEGRWREDVNKDLENRKEINAETYMQMRRRDKKESHFVESLIKG